MFKMVLFLITCTVLSYQCLNLILELSGVSFEFPNNLISSQWKVPMGEERMAGFPPLAA